VAGCTGMRSLLYNWTVTGTNYGANLIQVLYTNTVPVLSDSQTFTVAPPLQIANLSPNNQLVLWDSVPGVNYEVLATTNLNLPFEPISGVIPSQGSTTSYYDTNTTPQKFYEIEMLQ
jgi:hypothetical protein